MTEHHNSDGQSFTTTPADEALVAPLGTLPEGTEEQQRLALVDALKKALFDPHLLGQLNVLPNGLWDAWLDEGDFQCGVADCDENFCCDADHQLVTRPSDPARDDVFVRIPAVDATSGCWDVEVFTRNRTPEGGVGQVAVPCIQGEPIEPEDLVRDLGALLAVFRLFVQQGRV